MRNAAMHTAKRQHEPRPGGNASRFNNPPSGSNWEKFLRSIGENSGQDPAEADTLFFERTVAAKRAEISEYYSDRGFALREEHLTACALFDASVEVGVAEQLLEMQRRPGAPSRNRWWEWNLAWVALHAWDRESEPYGTAMRRLADFLGLSRRTVERAVKSGMIAELGILALRIKETQSPDPEARNEALRFGEELKAWRAQALAAAEEIGLLRRNPDPAGAFSAPQAPTA